MKTNLRDKFRDFLASEEGQVGAKAPLALGVATGSLLLAQAMPASAIDECPCLGDEICVRVCDDWSVNAGCIGDWHNVCIPRP